MPPKKRRMVQRYTTDNEMSGNESEASLSSSEIPPRETSDEEHESDDSSDMDLAECETRRAELLKDVQDLEQQFLVLREQLYKERLKQVDNQISELKAGTSKCYVSKLSSLEDERRMRVEVAEVQKEKRLENIENHYEAEKLAAKQNLENEKVVSRDEIHSELMDTIKRLEEDRRNSEIVWGKDGKFSCKKTPTVRAKKAVTVSGPYIVYMLRPEEIMEDWTAIRKACQDD